MAPQQRDGDDRRRDTERSVSNNNAARAVYTRESEANDSNSDDMGSDEFAQLSKSVPSAVPVLEPEPRENAIFSPDRKRRSLKPDPPNVVSEASETSPLLGRNEDPERRPSTAGAVSTSTTTGGNEAGGFLSDTNPGRFWFIFLQLLAILFISSFDGTIMAASHPVITSDFKAANSASWLSTSYLLMTTAFQPLLGRLSDALGRKPLYVGGSILLTLSTAWCALAGSIETFIAARALCGLGAGAAVTMASIIISDLVPIERRGVFQAYINITYGVGAALGAAVGGAMAESIGWRWEFGVQVPPLVICVAISLFAIPGGIGKQDGGKTVRQELREFDIVGSVLLSVSITFFILGLNLGGNVLPWSHPFVVASLVIFGTFFPTLIWVESRVAKPIMPLQLLRQSPHANLIFSNFIAALLLNAFLFNVPLYFQSVLLSSATSSGLRLVLPSVVSSVAGAMTGFAITWSRRLKWPPVSGAVMYFVGGVALVLLRRNLPSIVYHLVLVPSAMGQGLQFPGTFMALLASSKQSEQAVITSTLVLWRSLGMVLGVAVSSLVVQNALVYYLNMYVDGPEKSRVIPLVRKSVEEIVKLDMPYREQVVRSYEASMRLTFIVLAIMAGISLLMLLPIKLPRLAPKSKT